MKWLAEVEVSGTILQSRLFVTFDATLRLLLTTATVTLIQTVGKGL